MLNIISLIIGVVALLMAIIGFVPLLGSLNWLIVPFALIGVLLGALSRSDNGRNLCLIVTAICLVRLFLGGGIF
jgi:putative exporter of polyketide antibiotics